MTIERDGTIRTRPATGQDIPILQGLLSELHSQHYDAMPERFLPQAAGELDSKFFQGCLGDPSQHLVVAEEKGQVVGYARAQCRSNPDGVAHRARTFVEVHEIVVSEAVRGAGAGKRLMEDVVAWARRQKASGVELSVYAFNGDALAFYRRIGMSDMRITLAMALD